MIKVLKVEAAVHKAINGLDEVQQAVINRRFGINGCAVSTYQDIATALTTELTPEQLFVYLSSANPCGDGANLTERDIKNIEAIALRALSRQSMYARAKAASCAVTVTQPDNCAGKVSELESEHESAEENLESEIPIKMVENE